MASSVPRTLFDAQRSANERMDETLRGFRAGQVRAFIQSRRGEFPSYGEIMRELDFYDRAGAYRVVKRLKERGAI